jgi:two-component system, LytTR family, sensor histidine kinase AlgZ
VDPIPRDRRWLAALSTAVVLVAASTGSFLARGPHPLTLGTAVGIAIPLAIVALVLLIPVRYVCQALPLGSASLSRLLVTHGLGALVLSSAWVSLGAGLARFLASVGAELEPGMAARYHEHAPGLLAGGALLYLLSAFFHYMLLAVEASRRAEQQSLEMAVLARDAEIKALKAQVHPHFLFNSLNSISALTASNPGQAREMCILLAEFFRRSLALGDRLSVSLEEELAVARSYLAIEGLRFGRRLAIEETIDEASKACFLPPLLLQPLVENAIRHGIATLVEGGVVRLTGQTDGRILRLQVDNPFDPESPARPGIGLGLSNVRKRLLVRYGEAAQVDAERAEDHFRVTLFLPAQGPE